jgi:hypothetical protein
MIDQAFWAFGAAVGTFVLLLPNAFIYLASYGGRMEYKPSALMVTATRVCGAAMLVGSLVELLR